MQKREEEAIKKAANTSYTQNSQKILAQLKSSRFHAIYSVLDADSVGYIDESCISELIRLSAADRALVEPVIKKTQQKAAGKSSSWRLTHAKFSSLLDQQMTQQSRHSAQGPLNSEVLRKPVLAEIEEGKGNGHDSSRPSNSSAGSTNLSFRPQVSKRSAALAKKKRQKGEGAGGSLHDQLELF